MQEPGDIKSSIMEDLDFKTDINHIEKIPSSDRKKKSVEVIHDADLEESNQENRSQIITTQSLTLLNKYNQALYGSLLFHRSRSSQAEVKRKTSKNLDDSNGSIHSLIDQVTEQVTDPVTENESVSEIADNRLHITTIMMLLKLVNGCILRAELSNIPYNVQLRPKYLIVRAAKTLGQNVSDMVQTNYETINVDIEQTDSGLKCNIRGFYLCNERVDKKAFLSYEHFSRRFDQPMTPSDVMSIRDQVIVNLEKSRVVWYRANSTDLGTQAKAWSDFDKLYNTWSIRYPMEYNRLNNMKGKLDGVEQSFDKIYSKSPYLSKTVRGTWIISLLISIYPDIRFSNDVEERCRPLLERLRAHEQIEAIPKTSVFRNVESEAEQLFISIMTHDFETTDADYLMSNDGSCYVVNKAKNEVKMGRPLPFMCETVHFGKIINTVPYFINKMFEDFFKTCALQGQGKAQNQPEPEKANLFTDAVKFFKSACAERNKKQHDNQSKQVRRSFRFRSEPSVYATMEDAYVNLMFSTITDYYNHLRHKDPSYLSNCEKNILKWLESIILGDLFRNHIRLHDQVWLFCLADSLTKKDLTNCPNLSLKSLIEDWVGSVLQVIIRTLRRVERIQSNMEFICFLKKMNADDIIDFLCIIDPSYRKEVLSSYLAGHNMFVFDDKELLMSCELFFAEKLKNEVYFREVGDSPLFFRAYEVENQAPTIEEKIDDMIHSLMNLSSLSTNNIVTASPVRW